MIRISYLLPCYKVEKYIRACIDSIYRVPLPLNEFEVLCFDDCSPDGTPHVLDQLAKEHANMRVIHSKENVGSGGGRNTLLSEAKGNYIWYIDPDDLVVPKNVIPMLSIVEQQSLDVLLFNYRDITGEGAEQESGSDFKDTAVLDGLSFVDKVFGSSIVWHMGYPWRFMVRREYLINCNILFPERMVFQDTVWMPKVMMRAKRIQSTHIVGYHYRHHEASVCGRFDTIYPGKSIYTWSIKVSNLLIAYADELKKLSDTDSRYGNYAKVFRDYAVAHYIHRLPVLLCRTQKKERSAFYTILKNEGVPEIIKPYIKGAVKVLVQPTIGYCVSNMMAAGYRICHLNK